MSIFDGRYNFQTITHTAYSEQNEYVKLGLFQRAQRIKNSSKQQTVITENSHSNKQHEHFKLVIPSHRKILVGLRRYMSKYFSVVILDGISTQALVYMASDWAREKNSVFVELERFDQSAQLTVIFHWQQIPFSSSIESQDWRHAKSLEVILPENLAAHCVDDKPNIG